MIVFLLNLLDNLVEKNKNVAYLSSFIMLAFLCIQMYDVKQQVVIHSNFIGELRRANVIKQAESIKNNVNFLAEIELRLALEYCDEIERAGSIRKSCDIIYDYLSKPHNYKL